MNKQDKKICKDFLDQLRATRAKKIVNPWSKREIQRDGKVCQKLIKECTSLLESSPIKSTRSSTKTCRSSTKTSRSSTKTSGSSTKTSGSSTKTSSHVKLHPKSAPVLRRSAPTRLSPPRARSLSASLYKDYFQAEAKRLGIPLEKGYEKQVKKAKSKYFYCTPDEKPSQKKGYCCKKNSESILGESFNSLPDEEIYYDNYNYCHHIDDLVRYTKHPYTQEKLDSIKWYNYKNQQIAFSEIKKHQPKQLSPQNRSAEDRLIDMLSENSYFTARSLTRYKNNGPGFTRLVDVVQLFLERMTYDPDRVLVNYILHSKPKLAVKDYNRFVIALLNFLENLPQGRLESFRIYLVALFSVRDEIMTTWERLRIDPVWQNELYGIVMVAGDQILPQEIRQRYGTLPERFYYGLIKMLEIYYGLPAPSNDEQLSQKSAFTYADFLNYLEELGTDSAYLATAILMSTERDEVISTINSLLQ